MNDRTRVDRQIDDDTENLAGLDLDAALIGTTRPAQGWAGAVAAGRHRRRRRTGLLAGMCIVAVLIAGVAFTTRGRESSTPLYTNEGPPSTLRGDVIYFLPPSGSEPQTTFMTVYTTGVYYLSFATPDGAGWRFGSDGVDSDPNVVRWSFDEYADRRWSIESTRFGTIEMACSAVPDLPEGFLPDSMSSIFNINGIDYRLYGESQGSLPKDCESARDLDAKFLAVLDGLGTTDLQTWMATFGITDIQEPLPNPPSTDLPPG